MYHEARSLSLLDRELKDLLVEDVEEKGEEDEGKEEKEKPKEVEKRIKKDDDVKKANESGKDKDKAKEDIRKEKEFLLEREHAFLNSLIDSHHRLTKSISEKVYPAPICIVDNTETNTKATIWADMKTREVSFSTLSLSLSLDVYPLLSNYLYLLLLSCSFFLSPMLPSF